MSLTVYEMVNSRLHEIYVGISALRSKEQFDRDKLSPPSALRRWDFESHDVYVRELGLFLEKTDALQFQEEYSGRIAAPGWKVLSGGAPS